MIELPSAETVIEAGKVAGWVLFGLYGAWKSRGAIRKRTSKDAVVSAKNQAEVDIMKWLQSELTTTKGELTVMTAQRNEAVSRVGGLEAQNQALHSRLEEASGRINRMETELQEVRMLLNDALLGKPR